ncbi:MAG: hypothetical protein ACR2ID_07895 [Chthoniobacterales bacterium]
MRGLLVVLLLLLANALVAFSKSRMTHETRRETIVAQVSNAAHSERLQISRPL